MSRTSGKRSAPRVRRPRKRAISLSLLALALFATNASNAADHTGIPPPTPAVLTLAAIRAQKAAALILSLYPHVTVRADRDANALIVIASPDDLAAIRAIIAGIDIKDPNLAVPEAVQLHIVRGQDLVGRLRGVFPKARFVLAPNRTLLVSAASAELPQIKTVIAAIDAPPVAPTSKPIYQTATIRLEHGDPRPIARALAHAYPDLRIAVSGADLLIDGTPDTQIGAKALAASLDHVGPTTTVTKVYRLRAVDATSVAALLGRSFHGVDVVANHDLNALTVTTSASMQDEIGDAVSQLDGQSNTTNAGSATANAGPVQTEIYTLKAAVPAANGQASTTAADIAQSVLQALAVQAPDLKITVHPNSSRLILSGSVYSIGLAKDLIARLDVAEPLVELDTEVYEVDDGLQKQLGFKFPTAALSTTFSEVTPSAAADGSAPRISGLQAVTRTPLSLQAELDFLVSTNRARILEDPRITTFSGRTASLRAGETVNILTTTGGGTGTVATTQIQSFQTGVTLDITPVVNTDDYVTVSLHPSVNTEAGISAAGVPNIQNRDTTTTVGLHDGQTIVVGGLIEDTNTRTVSKVPFLGDLPLVGRLFQDVGDSHTRNELVVTVTPHILKDGFPADALHRDLPPPPTAAPLPRIEADATLPPRRMHRESPSEPAPVLTPAPEAPQSNALPARPSTIPSPAQAPITPAPAASAFAQTNVFTFGSPPPNNYADPSQTPQIFFARAAPTVAKLTQPIAIAAITTSNVVSLSFGTSVGDARQSLGSVGIGKWQGSVTIGASSLAQSSGNVTMYLTATTSSGANTSISIPFTVPPGT